MSKGKPPARRSYATDLSNVQWERITPMIPDARAGGRPRKTTSRELVNAVLYFLRVGSAWRLLPHDLSPWQTVYYYLRRLQEKGVWQHVHHALVLADRERCGQEGWPLAAILDSRWSRPLIKGGEKGYDADEEITGRKRHVLILTAQTFEAIPKASRSQLQGSRRC